MIVIGENINATIPSAKKVIMSGDAEKLARMAVDQANAGAAYIDVNVATGKGGRRDEIAVMEWAVKAIQGAVDKPLCIDSADPEVLEAGIRAASGPVMINSTTAESGRMEPVLMLAKKFDAPIIALAMDEKGIPKSVEGRLDACEKIVNACGKIGISLDKVYFDALVIPVSTDAKEGVVTLETLTAIQERFPESKTVLGLSNISFGLPARANINAAFLHMAVWAGLDAVILNPTEKALMGAVRTAEAIIGKDRHFRRYMRMYRKR